MYSLHRGQGWWEVSFEGGTAVVRDSRGLQIAAWLLQRPHAEPMHGLQLLARLHESPELPAQRSLALDRWEAARKVRNRLRLLEQIIEDSQLHPVERREAEAEREALVRECAHWQDPVRDNATRAVDAVRKALTRLVGSLERATDAQGQRQGTLRAFGQHLRRYVMLPSGRGWGARTRSAFPGGRFTYEPPVGVVWQVN